MYRFGTMEKILKMLLKTHPNPTLPIQELYDNSTNKREKEEIAVLAYGWGIKINEIEKLNTDCEKSVIIN